MRHPVCRRLRDRALGGRGLADRRAGEARALPGRTPLVNPAAGAPPIGARAFGLVGMPLMEPRGSTSFCSGSGASRRWRQSPRDVRHPGGAGICGLSGPTPTMVRLAAFLSGAALAWGLSREAGGMEVSFTWA